MPRWPGGWFAGSSQPSLPGWPASVVSSDQVSPPSRLSKTPGASTPTSTARAPAASAETFEIFSAAPRRTRGPRSSAPTSRRGRGCARPPSRATRSRRRRRSRRTRRRGSRGRPASPRRTGRAAASPPRSSLSSRKQPLRVPTIRSVWASSPPVATAYAGQSVQTARRRETHRYDERRASESTTASSGRRRLDSTRTKCQSRASSFRRLDRA